MTVVLAENAGFIVTWLADAGSVAVWCVVLSFIFVECALIIGLFLPGDALLFFAGVILANRGEEVSAWALAGAALVVAIIGNLVGYEIGRRSGTRLAQRKGARILNKENLDKARAFLDRRGFLAVVLARWIPYVRTLAPLIAGAAGMNRRRYMTANSLGAVLWVPTLVLVGYYAADLFSSMPWVQDVGVLFGVVTLVGGTVWGLWRYRQELRNPLDSDAEEPEPAGEGLSN